MRRPWEVVTMAVRAALEGYHRGNRIPHRLSLPRGAMSVTVMAEVWRLDLPKAEKLVLLAFADHAHDDGTKSYPGIARLRYKTGLSESAVHRALTLLKAAGLIVAEAYATGGRGKATEFRVVTAAGTTLAEFEEWREINAPRKGPKSGTVSIGGAPRERVPKPPRTAAERVPKPIGKGATSGTPTIIEPSLREPSVRGLTELEECSTQGCDRGRHRGAHSNPWFDAIEQALGHKPPKQEQSLWAALANRARDSGIAPGRIIAAAQWIARSWGPEKLTIGSLNKHLERALAPISQATEADAAQARQDLERQRRLDRIVAAAKALPEGTR